MGTIAEKIPQKINRVAGEIGGRIERWWYGPDGAHFEIVDPVPDEPIAEAELPPPSGPDEGEAVHRFDILQEVWGAGYSFPGGRDYVLGLLKPLGFNPAMNVLDLTIGLCGPVTAVVQAYDIYVTGMESSAEAVAFGKEALLKAGLAKRVSLAEFDPEMLTLKTAAYDGIYAQHLIENVRGRERFLGEIRKGLKTNGQFTFTAFATKRENIDPELLSSWMVAEGLRAMPWSSDQFVKVLNGLGFIVHIAEDQSERFVAETNAAWAAFMSRTDLGAVSQKRAKLIAAEANLSTQRTKLMTAGLIGAYRFYAVTK